MTTPALVRPRAAELPAPRTVGIVAAYVVVFFVLLPVLLWGLGGRWDTALRLPRLPAPLAASTLGALAAVVGTWGMAASMYALWTVGRGLPISHLPPSRLVTSGPYRWFRHPIYVSYTLAFAGAGLLAGSIGRGLLAPLVLTAGWVVYAVRFEEPRLVARHGPRGRAHLERTPLFAITSRLAHSVGRLSWSAARPPLQWLADHPVLFRVGPTVWVTYGAIAAACAAVTMVMIAGLLSDLGLSPSRVNAYAIGLVIAIVSGARLVWLLYQWSELRTAPLATLRTPGFVSWGGYVGLIAFSIAFAGANDVPALAVLDRAFLPAMGCCAFSRLACISYGCCYGMPAAWGLRWRRPETKAVREHGIAGAGPRIPTPAFAGAMALAVFAILVACTWRQPPAGFTTGLGLFLYALGRFAVDATRDEKRFAGAGLTAGQIGSAIAATLGIVLMFGVQGPSGWPPPAGLAAFRPVLSSSSLAGVIVLSFLAYGFHWKRVGRW